MRIILTQLEIDYLLNCTLSAGDTSPYIDSEKLRQKITSLPAGNKTLNIIKGDD
tara:strand:- start:1231 stop:1392 length:162 start_codon:yes stop_codon:yes gene_type:complete